MTNLNISDETLRRLRNENIKLYYETFFNSKMFEEYSLNHVHVKAEYLKNVSSMHNALEPSEFIKLSEEEQIDYINNACPLNVALYLENEEISIKYKDIIMKRIIKNQDLIFY